MTIKRIPRVELPDFTLEVTALELATIKAAIRGRMKWLQDTSHLQYIPVCSKLLADLEEQL